MDDGELDPRELLDRLHEDRRSLAWSPLPPSTSLSLLRQHPVRAEESLAFLHGHWALPDRPGGGRGPRALLGRLVGRIVFRVLGHYLLQERELLAQVVRTNETLARRCDDLATVMAERFAAQAENEARLAAWLDVHVPGGEHAGAS
ncbi:MAG TPA: hypothetical protein VE991_09730 [Acidimicrobiales bacterium]|nr:hypothetical protein [Acidimicrobiales bacterium]